MRLFLPAATLAACTALPLAAQQAAKRPMTFADLAAMKRVSDPQVSPSGKWVLFGVTDVVLEKNTKTNHLWAVPLDGKTKEAQLTTGSGESNGRFSPDGKQVMYTAADDKGRSQIFVAPWDGAAGRTGAGHAVTSLETEADGAIWAPDSQHFLFVSNVYPECESHAGSGQARNTEEQRCNELKDSVAASSQVQARIFDNLLYRHWNQFTGPKHSHIFYAGLDANPAGAAPTDLSPASVIGDHEAPTFSLGGPLGYAISPDGKEVAYSVNLDKVPAESTNNDIFILQLGADPKTARKVSTSPGSDDGPQYSPDGKYLAWRSQAKAGFESDKYRLLVMERTTGQVIDPLTATGGNRSLTFRGSADEFKWLADSTNLIFTSALHGEEPYGIVSTVEHTPGYYQHRIAGSFEGEFADVAMLSDYSLLATRMMVTRPSEVVVLKPTNFDPESGKKLSEQSVTILTHVNDSTLDQVALPKMDSFSFTGAAGSQVNGFLIRPPNFDPAKKYPLKFLIHGGPQGAWGDAWSYRWNPELLAANGYVVVMINPRGSTGYGQQFTDEVSGDWGGRAYTDLMRGLDFAEKTYPFIDKTRECALGASYGGYMANWVLTHTDRFKCIVTHDGMYNPQSAFGTTEELWFNEWEFRPMAKNPGAPPVTALSSRVGSAPANAGAAHATVEQTKPSRPWDFYDKPVAADPFRKWSPMLAIKNAHTPTLVIHGQRDYRLDVSEGFQLFTALQLLNVPSKMLYFPDEGHWVLKPKNSELWYETVNDWCDRWTGTNKYASMGPEKNPAAVVATGTGSRGHGTGKTNAPRGADAGVQNKGSNSKVDK